MRFAWLGDFNDASTFADILLSSSPQNLPGYSSERYDDLLAAALDEPDPAERSKLMTVQKMVIAKPFVRWSCILLDT